MNKLFKLVKINLLGLIRGRESKNKTKFPRSLILILFFAAVSFYSYNYAQGIMQALKVFHAEELLIVEFFVLISIILVVSNFKKISGLLFTNKDFDILLSMPVKKHQVVLSKMIDIYLGALGITIAVLIPPYIIYITSVSASTIFHVLFFITLPFVPLIPVVVSLIIGYLISYISSFFKKKIWGQLILTALIFGLFFYLGYVSGSSATAEGSNMVYSVTKALNSWYPLARMYHHIINNINIIHLLLFILINVSAIIVSTIIVSKTYVYVNNKFNQVKKSKNHKIKELHSNSRTKAMLKKDFKRLFSSFNYLLNTNMGTLFIVIISISLFISRSAASQMITAISTVSSEYTLPLIFILLIGLVYPVAVSLSLEGNSFYILRNLPINFKFIVKEKILFNLIILFIPIVLLLLAELIVVKISISLFLVMLVIYFSCAIMFPCLQLLFDIRFIKLGWTNEIKVIKQSIQVFLSIIIGALMGTLTSSFIDSNVELYIFTVGLVLFTIISYIVVVKYGSKKFEIECN